MMENKNLKISIRVIILFITAILISFIPDTFPKFFGDWLCEGWGNWNDKTKHCLYSMKAS